MSAASSRLGAVLGLSAWEGGCSGLTVVVDGVRRNTGLWELVFETCQAGFRWTAALRS